MMHHSIIIWKRDYVNINMFLVINYDINMLDFILYRLALVNF